MKSKLKLTALALIPMSLASCGSSALSEEESSTLNASTLYDPHSVTLTTDKDYQFKEGVLKGRDQKFYSQAAYSRALSVGNSRNQ